MDAVEPDEFSVHIVKTLLQSLRFIAIKSSFLISIRKPGMKTLDARSIQRAVMTDPI